MKVRVVITTLPTKTDIAELDTRTCSVTGNYNEDSIEG
jgi:hypothetical protein